MLFNLFAVSALLMSTTVYAAQEAQCVTQHIASGYDSCASISHQYGINVHDFQNWNYDLGNDPRYCRPPIPGRAYCVRIGRVVDNRGRGHGGPPNHPKRETKVVKRADKKKEKEKEKENDKKTKEKAKKTNKEAKAEKKKEEKAHNKELKAEEKKYDKEAKAEEKKEEKAIDKKDKAEEKKEEKQHDKEGKEKVLEENKEHDAKIEADDKKHEESKDKGKESKENKKGGSKDTHKNKVKKSSNEMEEFTSTDSYQKSSDDGVDDDSSKGHKDTEGLDLAPHTNPNCKKYYVVQDQDSCDSVSKKNHISNQELYDYNTGLHRHGSHECDNLDTGKAYCVAI